jgi:hypothetical protein
VKSAELVMEIEKPKTSMKQNRQCSPHSLSSLNPSSSFSSAAELINELNECYSGLNSIGLPIVFIDCVIIQLFHALSSSLSNMYVKK